MAELNILKQFTELFENVKQSLYNYNNNLRNEFFYVDENEDNKKAYKRGETLFDQFDENLINLNILISKEKEINEFFIKCKENKQRIINEKNEIINKLLRIKKNDKNVTKEEYLTIRNEWNKKREETKDERNRRECEEMLEEIKEQKNELNNLIEQAKKEHCKTIVKEEFNKISDNFVKQNEYEIFVSNFDEFVKEYHENMSTLSEQLKNKDFNNNEINPLVDKFNIHDNHDNYRNSFNTSNRSGLHNSVPLYDAQYGDKISSFDNFNGFRSLHHNLSSKSQPIQNNFSLNLSLPQKIDEYESPKESKYHLNSNQIKQLEEWTSLKCGDIIFDSENDNWSKETSIFNDIIFGKKQLTFIIEDEEGEKFGYYLNTEVVERYFEVIATDNKTFHFNLQSKNERLKQPMKFEIKDLEWGGINLFEKSHHCLITLGNIYLYKQNQKSDSCCKQYEERFNYHGIGNALCGKIGLDTFIPKRILVIQMK